MRTRHKHLQNTIHTIRFARQKAKKGNYCTQIGVKSKQSRQCVAYSQARRPHTPRTFYVGAVNCPLKNTSASWNSQNILNVASGKYCTRHIQLKFQQKIGDTMKKLIKSIFFTTVRQTQNCPECRWFAAENTVSCVRMSAGRVSRECVCARAFSHANKQCVCWSTKSSSYSKPSHYERHSLVNSNNNNARNSRSRLNPSHGLTFRLQCVNTQRWAAPKSHAGTRTHIQMQGN